MFETATAIPSVDLKRGPLTAALTAAPTISVAAPATGARFPFAVLSGTQVIVLWYEQPSIRYDRYDIGMNTMGGASTVLGGAVAPTPINSPAVPPNLHAVRDAAGTVWVAFTTASNSIQVEQITAGPPPAGINFNPAGLFNTTPFLAVDGNDDVWLFWTNSSAAGATTIFHHRFVRSTGTWDAAGPTMVPGTNLGANTNPAAAVDPDGAIWLFWNSNRIAPANQDLWFVRRHPVTGTWSDARQLSGAVAADLLAFPLAASDGALWLLWQRQLGAGVGELFFRRLITRI